MSHVAEVCVFVFSHDNLKTIADIFFPLCSYVEKSRTSSTSRSHMKVKVIFQSVVEVYDFLLGRHSHSVIPSI